LLLCRGVVQLFNAISKAQKARRDAEAAGEKERQTVKETKSALLHALKPETQAAGKPNTGQERYRGTPMYSGYADVTACRSSACATSCWQRHGVIHITS
jgi:hypothetical protein